MITLYAKGLTVQVLDNAATLLDVQQNSPVPDADWLEGSAGTLNVLSHFSSPSGKTLQLAAISTLPPGVTVAGGSLAYDGTGQFGVMQPDGTRLWVADILDVTAV